MFISFNVDPCTLQVHASQLYEGLLEGLLLFLILWFYTAKPKPRLAPAGLFLAGYGVFRFLVEFLKEVQVEKEETMALNIGQQLSIPLIIIGLIILFRVWRNPKPALPGGKLAREAARK